MELQVLKAARHALGSHGIQHFVLDSVVHDLDVYTAGFLETLSSNFKLLIRSNSVRSLFPL